MPCLHLHISGRVQGVWFRESMKREAERLGMTGWVRNLTDGRVEAVACGTESQLEALLQWSAKGPPLARVDRVERHHFESGETFSCFEKRA